VGRVRGNGSVARVDSIGEAQNHQYLVQSYPYLVERAVRELIRVLEASHPSDEPGGGVLLDVTYGRARCVVSRAPLHTNSEPFNLPEMLSPRELEIASMVARGFTNKEIANVLDISTWTVSTHLRRVFSKLCVGTRAAMVAELLRSPRQSLPGN
jgi:DNA-binding NarL/FixJ family response regulator